MLTKSHLTSRTPLARRALMSLVASAVLALGLSASVTAATLPKPAATTGPATNVTATSAVITGSIRPNGQQTDFFVQYGTSTHYTAQTTPIHSLAYAGNPPVSVDLSNLAAATTYHYRLVASNPSGVGVGSDRTFTTPKIPLSIAIVATPNPIPFLSGTTVAGTLAGTGAGAREVVLQGNVFPYSAGFVNVGNPEVTNADGSFAFNLPSVPSNTQYRVMSTGGHPIISPVTTVVVNVDVTARVRVTHARHGARLRFQGTIAPAEVGSLVEIQRLVGRRWVNIATTTSKPSVPLSSRFDRRVRVKRGGFFRVFARINDGGHMSNASVPVLVPLRHR